MKKGYIIIILTLILIIILANTNQKQIPTINDTLSNEFQNEQIITIINYQDDAMEPHISQNNQYLFFNNKEGPNNKDLYYATKINETTYQFQGEIKNTNTKAVEGTPSLTNKNKLYFVSTRHHQNGTIFSGTFKNGTIINLSQTKGTININKPGWLNMDVFVSPNNKHMYTSHANFKKGLPPIESNIRYAINNNTHFNLAPNEQEILKNINTNYALEYAPEITNDQLEIFYTQLTLSKPMLVKLYQAKRNNIEEPFQKPLLIKQAYITDTNSFFEAPTITSNKQKIYYHKMQNNTFKIFSTIRNK